MPFYKEGEDITKRGYVCSAHRSIKNVCKPEAIDECLLANMVVDSSEKANYLIERFQKINRPEFKNIICGKTEEIKL